MTTQATQILRQVSEAGDVPAAHTRNYGLILGRAALSFIFILSGFGKIFSFAGTAGYMESKGFFLAPFFLVAAILIEVLGGLSVLTGYKIKWCALALIVFLIPASLIFHNFWTLEGAAQQQEMISFLKNISILGGLVYIRSTSRGDL